MKNDPIALSRRGLEVWRDVLGFEGYYAVSNLGRVKSLSRFVQPTNRTGWYTKEMILEATPGNCNYPAVTLYKDKKTHKFLVHRLVYAAFIGNAALVRHLDDNRSNPRLYNLVAGTVHDNVDDAVRNGMRPPVNTNGRITLEKVVRIKALLNEGRSVTYISEQCGVKRSAIYDIRIGKTYRYVH